MKNVGKTREYCKKARSAAMLSEFDESSSSTTELTSDEEGHSPKEPSSGDPRAKKSTRVEGSEDDNDGCPVSRRLFDPSSSEVDTSSSEDDVPVPAAAAAPTQVQKISTKNSLSS